MKIILAGLQKKALEKYIVERFVELEIVEKKPKIVLCYGGDGTLLYAERHYPGIPKALIRNSQVCHHCANIARDTILQLLVDGDYTVERYTKLQVICKEQQLVALNDVVVGHPKVNGTLRAKVYVNGAQHGDEVLGDGVVVSTPIGSTGYYQSITRSNFASGIGVAFNNSVNVINNLVLQNEDAITIEITRGPGMVVADNDEIEIPVSTGDRIDVIVSKDYAQIVVFPEEHGRFNVMTGASRVPIGFCQICKKRYE